MDMLKDYLKDTEYNLCDCTLLSIHEIQDRLKRCRMDENLVVFVERCATSEGFFNRLTYFRLDNQDSNYYIAHSRNYAVWLDNEELDKEELLTFLHQSKSMTKVDENFFSDYSEYSNVSNYPKPQTFTQNSSDTRGERIV